MNLVQNSILGAVHSFSKTTTFCRMTDPLPNFHVMQASCYSSVVTYRVNHQYMGWVD